MCVGVREGDEENEWCMCKRRNTMTKCVKRDKIAILWGNLATGSARGPRPLSPVCLDCADEKLRTISVGASVSHGQCAWAGVL